MLLAAYTYVHPLGTSKLQTPTLNNRLLTLWLCARTRKRASVEVKLFFLTPG
jgi:hypothetical protein